MGILESFELTGRKALVTGATAAMGRDIACALAEAGADVAVSGQSREKLKETVAQIAATGRRAVAVEANLSATAGAERAVQGALEALGGLDILVSAHGASAVRGDSLEYSEEAWDRQFDLHVKSVFFLCQAAGRHMIPRGRGKIVNMASTFSAIGMPGFAAYCATKGGVLQLTRALAAEWAPRGVNVNAVGPSAVRTEATAASFDEPGVMEKIAASVPANRITTTRDVAAAVVYLASPGSDMVHGHCLYVDGGLTAV